MFQRKIYNHLLDWKNDSGGKTALLIEGARRVGKSTVVEEFARNEYKTYLLIDFARVSNKIFEYFNDYKNSLDELFLLLSTEYNVQLHNRESLIIFDEVQKFPEAREMIKYLVADGRYDYIETGSLISIKENIGNIVIPSEERKLKMYPLDFEEFCWATNNDQLSEYIKLCFKEGKALDNSLHKKAMFVLKQYLLVGGMPQAVAAYVDNNLDFEKADIAKRDILTLYRDDIMKISDRYRSRVLTIFDQIPSFLSKHEKRVRLSDVSEGSTIDQYADTFFWLENSMVCNECFACKDPNVGLSINEDRSFVKCYMGDTGLLVSHAFDESELMNNSLYKQILNDNLSINEGMFYENLIAQMLVANGHKLYFYTEYNQEKHRNDIEIDFIISNQSKLKYHIYPIEVKSGKRYKTTSLDKFNIKFNERIEKSYIIHTGAYKEEENKIFIPAYMAMSI